MTDDRRLIVDTDTGTDDAMALLLAALSDRVTIEGATIVAGNAAFDREVENAKYTLDLAGADATVYEGARSPLLKDYEPATEVHGEGGLGGELQPETGIPSGDEHAVDYIVREAREHPGERTLVAIGPLTNVALALAREPDLGDLLDEVWVMGGAVNTLGNTTPAAEFNVWVDPDAAKRVFRDLDLTLVDWGVTVRDGALYDEHIEAIVDAADDSRFADFFATVIRSVREFTESVQDIPGITQPDPLAMACLLEPGLIERAERYHADVDEREGMTRGYTLVDEEGLVGEPERTRVIESVDAEGFRRLFADAVIHGDPHHSS